jgi:hypothetical protein
MNRRWKGESLFFTLAVLMSFHFAMTFARTLDPSFPDLHTFAYGPIDIPYRPRILMRWVYGFAYGITHDRPPHFAHGVLSAMQVTLFVIAFLALLAVIFGTRASITRLTSPTAPVRWMALLTVYMCCYQYLLVPQIRAQFPYDVPCVAVFAVGIFALLTKRRWLYYLVFLVGTFNRETTMFLPPLFIILALDSTVPLLTALKRMSLWRYTEATAQMVVWAGIVHWCNVKTNAVLGPTWALPKNIGFFLTPFHWPTLLSVFAFLWLPYVLWFRRIGNVNLQRVALLFPFWFVAMLWKADLLELRVHAEWIPYLTICLALIVKNSLQFRADAASPAAQTPQALLLG